MRNNTRARSSGSTGAPATTEALARLVAVLLLGILPATGQLVIDGQGFSLVQEGGSFAADNLATAGTAFAFDYLSGYAIHQVHHVNDGLYGNDHSWIGGSDGTFIGINLGPDPVTISSLAFGRDNTGTLSDRAIGSYTIQYTQEPNPDSTTDDWDWTTIATLEYLRPSAAPFAMPHVRHRFDFAPVEATGIRIVVSGGIDHEGGIAIDEIELYSEPMVRGGLDDGDGDGLTLTEEVALGTDPKIADTDGDGVSDGIEVREATNPKDPGSFHAFSRGLVAFFPFNESPYDETGGGNNGTVIGGPLPTEDRFGQAAAAYEFNRDGYISIGNDLLLDGASAATISGWFVLAEPEAVHRPFLISAGDARSGLDPFHLSFLEGRIWSASFEQTTRGNAAADRAIGIGHPTLGDPEVTVPIGEWVFFCMQFESTGTSSRFRLYLGNELVVEQSTDYSLAVEYDQPMPVAIGALTRGFNDVLFRGKIDDVRIYDRFLSEAEVAALWHQEATGGAPLQITEIAVDPVGKRVSLWWNAAKRGSYIIRRSDSLRPDSWVEIDDSFSGSALPFVDVLPADKPLPDQLFYEVEEQR